MNGCKRRVSCEDRDCDRSVIRTLQNPKEYCGLQ